MIDLHTYFVHPEKLDRDSLDALRGVLERYPYFQAARLLYLKNLRMLRDPSFNQELCRSVIYITHRAFLYHFLEGDLCLSLKHSVDTREGTTSAGDRTLTIIDAYLSSMPEESSYAAISNGIATDYASYLLHGEVSSEEAGVTPMRGQGLIDSFIEKADGGYVFPKGHEGKGIPAATADESGDKELEFESEDDSYFTETLAKIYIKQQRYAKAIEIIKKLSLKYPKKSTYFANQIKQLEELIINSKSKQ